MRCATRAYYTIVVLSLSLVLFSGTDTSAQVFVENFNDNSINPALWIVSQYGSGAQLAESNHQLEFRFSPDAHGAEFGARLVSVFLLRGDFDIQVDYTLPQWPHANGVRMAIALTDALYDDYGMERSSLPDLGLPEAYVADFGPFVLVPTDDFTGKLRIVRSGSSQTGYYYGAGGWTAVLTDSAPTRDITIQVHAWSHDYAFHDQAVLCALDNLTVNSGEIVGLPVPVQTASWAVLKALYR